ncbi:MAG TPA: FmdB family zinc ribbon protein [Thermoanaerobaculia bacterium]|nr:FmdB family zinc ribbon protein [Thermoanaerobaculia bacterium]
MPLYEYVCQSCGKKTEVLQRLNERPLKICPHCGGKLKKAISAPAIQFKGSGWYVTDYARAKKEGKKGSGSDSGETESKKEKPAETKPEAKKKVP